MVFAYQVLSMTNYCNLRCAYCDWKKKDAFPLNHEELEQARRNIRWSRDFADREFGDFLMGVFSGGEPFQFPELIEMFLDTYADKWVRISTNGLFDGRRLMPMLRRHPRLILTASLDGFDLAGNRGRFHQEAQLAQVKRNILQALRSGILVMVLCTLNSFSMDTFFEFADALYEAYRPYVDEGLLVMPAHYISIFSNTAGLPSRAQEERFLRRMEARIDDQPIFSRVAWHYQALMDYIKNVRHDDCRVERWSRCAHFLDDQMVHGHEMHSYLCPMRGYGDLGAFDTSRPVEGFAERYRALYDQVYAGPRCLCFVDWTAFDAVLSGEVSIEAAMKWFAFFRDSRVKDWIARYRSAQSVEDRG